MYSEKNGYARLNNYGGKLFNTVVGSLTPDQCDMQYELVRVQSSPFNPWYPIKEEVWTSYYNQEDPWNAEREKENMLKQRLASQMPPPKFVLPQQHNKQFDSTLFQNRLMSQQLGQQPPNNKQFIELNNSCSSCVNKNGDCKDENEYSFCYAPACSTMKQCVRDNSNMLGRKHLCTVVASPSI